MHHELQTKVDKRITSFSRLKIYRYHYKSLPVSYVGLLHTGCRVYVVHRSYSLHLNFTGHVKVVRALYRYDAQQVRIKLF